MSELTSAEIDREFYLFLQTPGFWSFHKIDISIFSQEELLAKAKAPPKFKIDHIIYSAYHTFVFAYKLAHYRTEEKKRKEYVSIGTKIYQIVKCTPDFVVAAFEAEQLMVPIRCLFYKEGNSAAVYWEAENRTYVKFLNENQQDQLVPEAGSQPPHPNGVVAVQTSDASGVH